MIFNPLPIWRGFFALIISSVIEGSVKLDLNEYEEFMTQHTSRLTLPFIQPGQAQKHITHNEALQRLDVITQLSVIKRHDTPPEDPLEGDAYIITNPRSGAWSGKDNNIASWQASAWAFFQPKEGWLCWLEEEVKLLIYTNQSWLSVEQPVQITPSLGINATADSDNKLNVRSQYSLFDNIGQGHQLKINKAAYAEPAALLFQNNYIGHAELGLIGDNRFRLKVSSDGQNWVDALFISPPSGTMHVRMPIQRNGHTVFDEGHAPGVLNVKGYIPDAADLNDYTETGFWHQSSNSNAGRGQNYPATQAGLLTVVTVGPMSYQTYRIFAGGGAMADQTFTRGRYVTTWSDWKAL